MPRKMENLAGRRFGKLLVVEVDIAASEGKSKKYWRCKCDCGKSHTTRKDNLLTGATQSCGCWNRESSRTHGLYGTHIYKKWASMKTRCNNPKQRNYHNYGGRGIKVCERWEKFEDFLEDMGLPPDKLHQIDRIDNDGNYEPENCRWVTPLENSRNKRTNVRLTHKGRTQTISEWADELGIRRPTLTVRIKAGWSVEDALETPVNIGNWGLNKRE